MEGKKLTIDDLLNALKNQETGVLENSAETWSRIGSRDSFSELGLDVSELDDFLKEFIQDNEYSNI